MSNVFLNIYLIRFTNCGNLLFNFVSAMDVIFDEHQKNNVNVHNEKCRTAKCMSKCINSESTKICMILKKYKTFSVLIYSYINTSGNLKIEKLCGNTTPAGRSVFTQFRVFPIFTSVDITVY